jgi:hypothetical protein
MGIAKVSPLRPRDIVDNVDEDIVFYYSVSPIRLFYSGLLTLHSTVVSNLPLPTHFFIMLDVVIQAFLGNIRFEVVAANPDWTI